jgi:hypothetical protein
MDLALNAMDEPRLVVPWDEIKEYLRKAAKSRAMPDPRDVVSKFAKRLPPGKEAPEEAEVATEIDWESESKWLTLNSVDSRSRNAN